MNKLTNCDIVSHYLDHFMPAYVPSKFATVLELVLAIRIHLYWLRHKMWRWRGWGSGRTSYWFISDGSCSKPDFCESPGVVRLLVTSGNSLGVSLASPSSPLTYLELNPWVWEVVYPLLSGCIVGHDRPEGSPSKGSIEKEMERISRRVLLDNMSISIIVATVSCHSTIMGKTKAMG